MHRTLAYTILFIWSLTDVGILWNYYLAPLAHLEYLTSWSHVLSILFRIGLIVHLYSGEKYYKCTVFFFYASGVLLASILVTFFVVILIDDELFTERVNSSLLPHYTFILSNGGCDTIDIDSEFLNSVYLEGRGIDKFASVGVMIVYNNLRHVFPAVAHVLVVSLLPTLRRTLVVHASFWKGPLSLVGALALTASAPPLLHWIVNTTVGEERLYRVDPCLPAFAMVISIIGAAKGYVAIDTCMPQLQQTPICDNNQPPKCDNSDQNEPTNSRKFTIAIPSAPPWESSSLEPPPAYLKGSSTANGNNRRFLL